MDDLLKDYKNLLDHTDEHLSLETLAIYNNLKEQLSQNEIRFVKRHLESCSSCEDKLNEIIEEDIEIDPINSEKPKIFKLPVLIKYAAAASIIITVGIALLFFLRSEEGEVHIAENEIKNNNNSVEELVKDSSMIIAEEEKVIDEQIKEELKLDDNELYAVNIVLENFIERNLRSEKSLEILSPTNNNSAGLPINFEWKLYDQDVKTELEIVNNKNVKVYNKIVEGSKYIFNDPLTNGLYYWKIKTDGKVSAIGKFLIK